MKYGINHLGIVPIRSTPSDLSEILSQMLFGEHFKILDETEKWVQIVVHRDDHKGWICKKQYIDIGDEDYNDLSLNDFPVCGEKLTYLKDLNNDQLTPISYGAILPYFKNNNCRIGSRIYQYKGALASKNIKDLEQYAKSLLNTPYLWGGKGPLGIDCSGLSQLTYQLCGISIPRDSFKQAEVGETIYSLQETNSGDLAFFQNKEGRVNHVAIILDSHQIIHSSGKVRIDKLDKKGIYALDYKRYTHELHSLKRVTDL